MRTIFSVTTDQLSYKISIGTGKTFRARDLDEVTAALYHYFAHGMPHDKKRCPLCSEAKQ